MGVGMAAGGAGSLSLTALTALTASTALTALTSSSTAGWVDSEMYVAGKSPSSPFVLRPWADGERGAGMGWMLDSTHSPPAVAECLVFLEDDNVLAGVEVELVAVFSDKGVYGADCERHGGGSGVGWGGVERNRVRVIE